MTAQEVSVPSTVDDFEEGDRVWFIHPKKNVKMLATVLKHPTSRFILRRDDGLLFSAVEDPADPDFPIKIAMLNKLLNTNSLNPGMKLSIKAPSKDGFVVRFYAIIERVRPGKEVVLCAPDRSRSNYRRVFVEGAKGETLEYQMAGWEIEE